MKRRKKTRSLKNFTKDKSSILGMKINNDQRLTLWSTHLGCIFDKGVNFQDRVITLTGDLEYPAFDIIDAALTELESHGRKGITLRIHSHGGSVFEALAIVGRIRSSKCKITTEGFGAIMSAATLILASGHKRRISKYSFFMHHEASYDIGYGRHSEHKNLVQDVENQEKQWCKWMEEFTEKDEKFWLKSGVVKDAYFDAEELLEMGVVDEII